MTPSTHSTPQLLLFQLFNPTTPLYPVKCTGTLGKLTLKKTHDLLLTLKNILDCLMHYLPPDTNPQSSRT